MNTTNKFFQYFREGWSKVSLDETPTADSVKPTEDVFKMIKENRAPAELIDLIAEELGVSDGTPFPTSIDHVYEIDGREYFIVDDNTADELWEEYLDNYFDEIVLPEIPSIYQIYINRKKWKEDARVDGRAHSLAKYDGEEHVLNYEGNVLYLYRVY